MNDTTDPQVVTAEQRRTVFEQLIGADKDHRLWSALDRVITSAQAARERENHEEVVALARHFPGLERAILAVWAHITRIDDVAPCGVCEPTPEPADGAS